MSKKRKKLSCWNRDCQNYTGPDTLDGYLKWRDHQEDLIDCASCRREEKAERADRKAEKQAKQKATDDFIKWHRETHGQAIDDFLGRHRND